MRTREWRKAKMVANKVLSVVLSVAMLTSSMPTAALAEEMATNDQEQATELVLDQEADDTPGDEVIGEEPGQDDEQQPEAGQPAEDGQQDQQPADDQPSQPEQQPADDGQGTTQDQQPASQPEQKPSQEEEQEPGQEEEQEPGQEAAQDPAQEPAQDDARQTTQEPTAKSAEVEDDDPSKEPLSYVDPNAEFPIREDSANPLLSDDELADATRRTLAEGGPEGTRSTFQPITVDGTTLESLGIEWTTASTTYQTDEQGNLVKPVSVDVANRPAGTSLLQLASVDDEVPEHQFQIGFSLAGKDRYEPGDIEIVIPASIWKDRNGDATMELTSNGLSIPEEGSTDTKKAEFVYRRVGDNIVITNNRRLDASIVVSIQGHFESVPAHTMTDLVKSGSSEDPGTNPLAATITVTTKGGHEITATSNEIQAQIDTYQYVNDAYKTAYSEKNKKYELYYDRSSVPSELRDAIPADGEYLFVRWAVAGSYTGNQPATLSIQDTAEDNYGCIMLGVSGLPSGGTARAEGSTVSAVLYDGYTTSLRTAYVWTAYPIDQMPKDGSTIDLINTVTVKAVGWDDELESEQSATGTVPLVVPMTYTIIKDWLNDNENEDGHRPDSVTAYVERRKFSKNNPNENPWEPYKTLSVRPDEDGTWKATWLEQPSTVKYEYRVYEVVDKSASSPFTGIDVEHGYVWAYDNTSGYAAHGEGTTTYTLSNRFETTPIEDVVVNKVWVDEDDARGYRPDDLKVSLVGKNYFGKIITVDEKTLQASQDPQANWKAAWNAADYGQAVWTWSVSEVLDSTEHMDESTDTLWWYTGSKAREVVQEEGSQKGTTVYTFTNTLHTLRKQTYTHGVRKTWIDNNNAAGNRPASVMVRVYRDNIYKETVTLSADNNWSYTYTEEDYRDHTYRFEEVTTGFSQGGYTEVVYNDDGSKDVIYHSGWKYQASGSGTSGNLVNTYVRDTTTSTHYPVIPWSPRATLNYMKKTPQNYQDQTDRAESGELYLNDVLSGRATTDLRFTLSGNSYHEVYTTEGNTAEGRMKRNVTFTLTDTGLSLDGHTLGSDDYRLTAVSTPSVNTSVTGQPDKWSPWTYRSGRVAYEATMQGLVGGVWMDYATIQGSTVTPLNGTTVSGGKIVFPADAAVTQTRLRVVSKAPGVAASYDVYAQLLPSAWIRSYVSQELDKDRMGSVGYIVCEVTNGATAQSIDDAGTQIFSKSYLADEYVHAFDQRVAPFLEKSFEVTANDKVMKQITVRTKVKLTQQSNITDAREWNNAMRNGDLPMSESGIWYDLVPEGMLVQLDTVRVGAGDTVRDAWVVENYRDSGRALLCVSVEFGPHESYSELGDRPAGLQSAELQLWPREGYKTVQTLQYDCLYPWKDAQNLGFNVRNVAAFEADEDVLGNTRGFVGEPDSPDAGNHMASLRAAGGDEELQALATNLDDERETLSFVYAGANLKSKVIDFASMAGIIKQTAVVGSDTWSRGRNLDDVDDPVVVTEGGAYMYRLAVASDQDHKTTNIIIADTLESYQLGDGNEEELEDAQDKGWVDGNGNVVSWKGRLTSLDLTALESAGVDPVVWWTDDPSVDMNSEDSEYFIRLNDREAEFDTDKLSQPLWHQGIPSLAEASTVTSLVIDCRKANGNADADHRDDDGNFVLPADETLSCTLYMRAPDDATEYMADSDGDGEADGKDHALNAHAYNNVHMSATTLPELDVYGVAETKHTWNNYTKVGIDAGELVVRKAWDDDGDRDGIRPEQVTVRLTANGTETDYAAVLSEENGWQYTFTHLPQVDENNKHIEYGVMEDAVEGYRLTSISRDGDEYMVTNSHAPEVTEVKVNKVWVDDTDNEGEVIGNRPSYIIVELFADGENTGKSAIVSAAKSWSASFENLLKYRDHGTEIVYTIVERPVADGTYIASYDVAEDGTLQVVNTYYPYGDLTVRKSVVGATDTVREQDKAFTFTFTFRTAAGTLMLVDEFAYETSDGRTGTVRTGGIIDLHADERAVIKDLPHGTKYTVTEGDVTGFTLTSDTGSAGSIQANALNLASFENRYSARGAYQPSVSKMLANAAQQRGQFKFEILDEDGTVLRAARNTPSPNGVTYREGTEGKGVESSTGTAGFGTLTFTESDDGQTFRYTVREVDDGQSGIIYDPTVYVLELTPHDNGDGTMVVDAVWKDGDDTELEGQPTFKNAYSASGNITMKAWKELKGRELQDQEFTFELLDQQGNVLQSQKNDADGNIVWEPVIKEAQEDDGDEGQSEGDASQADPAKQKPYYYDETDIGKTYYYAVREVMPNEGDEGYDDTVVYDKALYAYEVKVEDNGDGTLAISQRSVDATDMFSDGVFNENWEPGKTVAALFSNRLQNGGLRIEKHVDDVPEGHEDDTFKFRLELKGEDLPEDGSSVFDMEGVTRTREPIAKRILIPMPVKWIELHIPSWTSSVQKGFAVIGEGFWNGVSLLSKLLGPTIAYAADKQPDTVIKEYTVTFDAGDGAFEDGNNTNTVQYSTKSQVARVHTSNWSEDGTWSGTVGSSSGSNSYSDSVTFSSSAQTHVVIQYNQRVRSQSGNIGTGRSHSVSTYLNDVEIQDSINGVGGYNKPNLTERDITSNKITVRQNTNNQTSLGYYAIVSRDISNVVTQGEYEVPVSSKASTINGVVFTGWVTESGEQVSNISSYLYELNHMYNPPTEVRLIAQYTPTCVVQFDANGGTGEIPNIEVINTNGFYAPACTFTKPNATFLHWAYVSIDGTNTQKGTYTKTCMPGQWVNTTNSGENLTLVAIWDESITVTYDAQDGTFANGKTNTIRYSRRGVVGVWHVSLSTNETGYYSEVKRYDLLIPGAERMDISYTYKVTVPNNTGSWTSDDWKRNYASYFSGDLASMFYKVMNPTYYSREFSGTQTINRNTDYGYATGLRFNLKNYNMVRSTFDITVTASPVNTVSGSYAVPTPPAGESFIGWEDANGNLLSNDYLHEIPTDDITLYARYTMTNRYKVAFDANGGSGNMSPVMVNYSQGYTVPESLFSKPKCTFDSWNTKADGTGVKYLPGSVMPSPGAGNTVTLYAQWDENPAPELKEGVYEFELPANYALNIDGLPAGTAYSVYEETVDGWVLVESSDTFGTIEPTVTKTASFTNEPYDPDNPVATATIVGTKTFNGGAMNTGGYAFNLYELDSADAMIAEGAQPVATTTSVEGGAFQFGTLKFDLDDIGDHYYAVREVVPAYADDNTIYDDNVDVVTVRVVKPEDGDLSASVVYDSDGVLFDNKTKTGSLTVSKSVLVGNGDDSQKYVFEVALHDAFDIPLSTVDIQMPATMDAVPVDASSGSIRVALAAGETATVLGLPAGTVYEVTELGLALGPEVRPLPDLGWQQVSSEGTSGVIQAGGTSQSSITNTYGAAPGEAEITVYKRLVGRALSEGEFSFELYDADGKLLDTATNESASSEESHAGDGEVTFLVENIAGAGEYTYTIKEVVGTDENVTYSDAEITASVVMDDDGSGSLVPTSVTYSGGDADTEDTFVNALKPTSLELSKQVLGATGVSIQQEFDFSVRLSSGGSAVPDASYDVTVMPADDDRGVTAEGLTSTSVTYVDDAILVWYSAGEGFFADGTAATNVVAYDAQGRIVGGIEQVPEAPSTGKAFAGWVGEDGGAFDLAAALAAGEDANVYATYADAREPREVTVTSSGGVLTVSLHGGETATIDGLPLGANYEVTEGSRVGWTQTGSAGTTGTLESSTGEYQASITNQYRATGEAIITAKKSLTGSTLQAGQFSFELRDQYGALLRTASNDADGNVLFDPLPYNEGDAGQTYRYYVYEVTGNTPGMSYDATRRIADVTVADNGDGTLSTQVQYITVTGEGEDKVETPSDNPTAFENDHRIGSLQVTKLVKGEVPEVEEGEEPEFTFEVTLTPPEGEATTQTFTLKEGESKEFEDLIEGTEYVVREVGLDELEGWFVASEVGTEGAIAYMEQSQATITNRYAEDTTELAGQKHWQDDLEANRPESITVQLMDGERVVAEATTTAAEEWAYSFGEQPIKDVDGNEIAYTVREVEVPGYEASYYDSENPQEGVGPLDVVNEPKGLRLPLTGGRGLAEVLGVAAAAAALGLASLALLRRSRRRKDQEVSTH